MTHNHSNRAAHVELSFRFNVSGVSLFHGLEVTEKDILVASLNAGCVPTSSWANTKNSGRTTCAGARQVLAVDLPGNVAEVAKPVIRPVAIDVVNLVLRQAAIRQYPSQAMCADLQRLPIFTDGQLHVPRINTTGHASSPRAGQVDKQASVWVIGEPRLDLINTDACKHIPCLAPVFIAHDLGPLYGWGAFAALGLGLEVVKKRLNRPNGWVRAVAVHQLAGQVRRHTRLFGDLLPLRGASLFQLRHKGVKDRAHGPIVSHKREACQPMDGNSVRENPANGSKGTAMFRPSQYGVAAMTARETLSDNLRALMGEHHTYKSTLAIQRATEANGSKVGKSTIDRALKGETNLTIDHLQAIALIYGLDVWQIMSPGLRPKSPPVLKSIGETEDKLYQRIGELAKEIADLQQR